LLKIFIFLKPSHFQKTIFFVFFDFQKAFFKIIFLNSKKGRTGRRQLLATRPPGKRAADNYFLVVCRGNGLPTIVFWSSAEETSRRQLFSGRPPGKQATDNCFLLG
jgi:hypothetical protein